MDGLSSRAPRAVSPMVQCSGLCEHVNRAINDRPAHAAGRYLLSVVQAVTNTERL